jgi:hypothetical protein
MLCLRHVETFSVLAGPGVLLFSDDCWTVDPNCGFISPTYAYFFAIGAMQSISTVILIPWGGNYTYALDTFTGSKSIYMVVTFLLK